MSLRSNIAVDIFCHSGSVCMYEIANFYLRQLKNIVSEWAWVVPIRISNTELLPGCKVSLPVGSTFFGQKADLTSGLQCISCHPVTLLEVTRQNTVDVDLTPDFVGDNGLFGNSCGAGWCCQTIRVCLQYPALDNNWQINKWCESNCYTYNIF